MDWTNEVIDRLRALWAEGHSTAEIGRRLGITKNAVVGKAHRLNLSARPSPIRREPISGPVAASPVPAQVTIPVAAMEAPVPDVAVAPVAARPAPRAASGPPPASAVVRTFPRLVRRECCWPIGEPGTAAFRFCTAEATSGKPYCTEHAALAYVKVRDRREDAA